MRNIEYNLIDIELNINKKNYTNWITKCIELTNKEVGEISYIFCNDDYLLNINKEYLNHDYYTDIITFDYCKENTISGDLFISIERIKENASTHKTSFKNELDRVIIHGIIHLLGQKDKTPEEAKEMRTKEDYYLSLR